MRLEANDLPPNEPLEGPADRTHVALLASTFAIAVCGLVYELLAGTVSSYLLGDSVYQFSVVIGLFMAAMGFGSYLSRFVATRVTDTFVWCQLLIGIAGGFSAIVLFFAFSHLDNYEPFLILLCVIIGSLVGVEIPLVIRMLTDYQVLKLTVSNVFTVDYIGALLASILFPLVLIPHLGLLRTGLFFGLLNTFVAFVAIYTFRRELHHTRTIVVSGMTLAAILGGCFISADWFTDRINARLYAGEIIHTERTPYQQVVLTRAQGVVNLFLNGALQFSSIDEYRYHEALVHPALSLARHKGEVLVLGGGDGLAVREILKHDSVQRVTLVDIDPAITRLFRTNPLLTAINHQALNDPKVEVINTDAAKFLETTKKLFDIVIIDLPDPHDVPMSRLYTRWFYAQVRGRMSAHGVLATQATSPVYARKAFWSIVKTVASAPSVRQPQAPLRVLPYHAYIPTFGDWGFALASTRLLTLDNVRLEGIPTRYLDQETLPTLATFPSDVNRLPVEINTLESHALPGYYEAGWAKWYR